MQKLENEEKKKEKQDRMKIRQIAKFKYLSMCYMIK